MHPQVFDPAVYRSPSGAFELQVDPHDPHGHGAGSYQLDHHGRRLWSTSLPFTLTRAMVTDQGVVAGFAYRRRLDVDEDRVQVAIIDPSGEILLHEVISREREWAFIPAIAAHGLLADHAGDRMIVRGSEGWWVYRLSTSQRLDDITPETLPDAPDESVSYLGECQIPETSLLLRHQWIEQVNGNSARFLLHNADGELIWRLDLADDYALDNEDAEKELRNRLKLDDVALDCADPRRFRIWRLATGERIEYQVTHDDDGIWQIAEIRRPSDGKAIANLWNDPLVFPPVTLDYLGQLELDTPPGIDRVTVTGRCEDLVTTMDFQGNLHIIAVRDNVLHSFQPTGAHRRSLELLSVIADGLDSFPAIRAASNGDFHLIPDQFESFSYRFSADDRLLGEEVFEKIGQFIPWTWRFGATGKGRWLHNRDPYRFDELVLVDPQRRPVLRIRRRPNRQWLGHIVSILVSNTGSLAVASFSGLLRENPAISLYDPDGSPRLTVSLPMQYAVSLAAYRDGRILFGPGYDSDPRLSDFEDFHLLDVGDLRIRRLVLETPVPEKPCFFSKLLLSPDGAELWVAVPDGTLPTLHRYALPRHP